MAEQASEPSLADLDPMFAAPIGAKPGVAAEAPPSMTQTSEPGPQRAGATPDDIPLTTGAAVGAGVGLLSPKLEAPSRVPGLTQARANAPAARKAAEMAQSRLAAQQAAHASSLAGMQQSLATAQAAQQAAMDKYNAIRELAARAGLPAGISPEFEASGDKWSRKVVGSMGPGGEGVTEAARNYQMQKGLTPEESSKFRVGRSGIIEPNTTMPSNPMDRTAILREMQAAERAALEASQNLARQQGLLESATRKGPVSPQQMTMVANKMSKAEEAAMRLKELEKAAKGNMLARIFGKIPGVASGAMAGYELSDAYNALRKGDVAGAILPGMAGTGGALMLAPHPVAKAAGFALSVPPLAYQAYQAYQGRQQPQQPTQQQPAPLPPMQ